MGGIVEANCACGFHGRYVLGGGFSVPTALFPFWCRSCSTIVVLDMKTDPQSCPDCGSPVVSYSARQMSVPPSRRGQVFSWNAPSPPFSFAEAMEMFGDGLDAEGIEELRKEVKEAQESYAALDPSKLCWLHVGAYLCPACQDMTLHWDAAGCWD